MKTYGYPLSRWNAAKEEARQAMIAVAKAQTTICYSDLVQEITSIKFQAHDFTLFHLLGQASTEESQAGRGMLTAVVVRIEDGRPGEGFFDLARELGYDSSDRDDFWVSELNKVHSSWKSE